MLPPVALSDHVVPVRLRHVVDKSHMRESRNILSRKRSVDTFVSMGEEETVELCKVVFF